MRSERDQEDMFRHSASVRLARCSIASNASNIGSRSDMEFSAMSQVSE